MDFMLNEQQVNQYHNEGFVLLPQLFNKDEIGLLLLEAQRLISISHVCETNIRTEFVQVIQGHKVFNKIDPAIDISPLYRSLVNDARIQNTVTSIFAEPPALMKDKLIYKPSGHPGFNPHQDYMYWQKFPKSLLSVMVALESSDAENGALEVCSGCHLQELDFRGIDINNILPKQAWQRVDMQAGDVLLFHCLLPHRSAPNRSKKSRQHIYFTFNPASSGDHYIDYYHHYRQHQLSKMAEQIRRYAQFDPPVAGQIV